MQEDGFREVEFLGYSLLCSLREGGFRGRGDLDYGEGVAFVAGGGEDVEGGEGEFHFELVVGWCDMVLED